MSNLRPVTELPSWVPDAVRLYLSHTAEGRSLRDLARDQGCHPSTVMRQVRRFENRRDDPLVDRALARLDTQMRPREDATATVDTGSQDGIRSAATKSATSLPDITALNGDQIPALLQREAPRLLRRLAERGAVLAVAPEMDKAVILREDSDGRTHRLAVLDRQLAEAFALRDWISCRQQGRVSSYVITACGRVAMRQMLGDTDDGAGGAIEIDQDSAERARLRPALAESPVSVLARRRNRDGTTFLGPDLVAAAERLREDFELAQMGDASPIDWESWLTRSPAPQMPPPDRTAASSDTSCAARARVASALADLGPGLGDMVLRCCCYLEGLEATEKHMGWSARSGKIVLRIALERLKLHYARLGETHKMIG